MSEALTREDIREIVKARNSANKMLSSLGYVEMANTEELTRWTLYAHEYKYEIDFKLKGKTVLFKPILRDTGEIKENGGGMSMEELKAISKKCEELGWIEE